MKKRFHFLFVCTGIFLFFLNTGNIRGQGYDKDNRWLIGGGLGAQFGTITLIEVSPTVAYRVTDRFIPGIGLTYQYYKINYDNGPDYETNIYGGSAYARYYLFRDFFAHAEFMLLSYERYELDQQSGSWDLKRVTYPTALIGGGYRAWIGRNAAATITVLYNLNETIDSPYTNPIVRIGFQVGL
ncbi:MAG: hypothetical protein K9G58_01890 [Bacteroidales bacterium]|nr:hypothetical protein [Bacteroidales bacterium]MCF8387268.1 hypothetical protein [Bacteroidales bacterium]MCF8396886.1 hypothetical protein [Bacteroidales bacterium]